MALVAALALTLLAPLQERQATPLIDLPMKDLGRIDFPNSGSEQAQFAFLRGVLLLHSFEYDDAAESFREAQELDPTFALATWGEALTHEHLLWGEEDVAAAREALARLGDTPAARRAKAPTEREAGLLSAVEVLFGEGERLERLRAYSKAMGELSARFPGDHELAAFYAISILPTSGPERDLRTYMRAAGIAEEIYRENPEHPGALHYLIHCYDDPIHAPLGLRQARTYAQVAPAAAHALHMPSHIFVALGMWADSASSNEASSAAADARRARKGLSIEERGYHSLWWLAYSYWQLGRAEEARALFRDMVRDEAESGSKRTRFHLVAMRSHQVIEGQEWDGEAVRTPVDTDGLRLATTAAYHFTSGFAALRRGEPQVARTELVAIRTVCSERTGGDPEDVERGCCLPAVATSGYDENGPAVRTARVMQLELAGLLEIADGALDDGFATLRRAVEVEDEMAFDFGPPHVVKPAHELLGEELLARGRPEDLQEARAEFEKALLRAPRRSLSLLGLARAAAGLGDTEASQAAYADLATSWQAADQDLPLRGEVLGAGG